MSSTDCQHDWQDILHRQNALLDSGQWRDVAYRQSLLRRLKDLLVKHEEVLMTALAHDLGKSWVESYASELGVVLNEIDFLIRHIGSWSSPRRAYSWRLFSSLTGPRTSITLEPLGSVLIISPWNYPLQLSLSPLAGALAAGNSCFLKPSEQSPAISHLLNQLLTDAFPSEIIQVVEGDATVTTDLLSMEWDFVFFTGSSAVGKAIEIAVAGRHIPLILELGGKNPCIVDSSGLNEVSARRIVWGKFLNAGQTCVAPDSIWVKADCLEPLLELLIEQIEVAFGADPSSSPDYGRIGHPRQLDRLRVFLQQGRVRKGGQIDISQSFLGPTLMTDIPAGSPIMEEEIFGPILPIIPFESLDKLVDRLRLQPEPLAVYLFSRNRATIKHLGQSLRCGAFCVNQVIRHAASPKLPFGGVGASGYGRYHGRSSMMTFSYQKIYYHDSLWPDWRILYPPYSSSSASLAALKRLRRWLF